MGRIRRICWVPRTWTRGGSGMTGICGSIGPIIWFCRSSFRHGKKGRRTCPDIMKIESDIH